MIVKERIKIEGVKLQMYPFFRLFIIPIFINIIKKIIHIYLKERKKRCISLNSKLYIKGIDLSSKYQICHTLLVRTYSKSSRRIMASYQIYI